MNALSASSPNMSAIGHIVEDSKDLLLQIIGALVAHTRRQANDIAHRLARFGLHDLSCLLLVQGSPRFHLLFAS